MSVVKYSKAVRIQTYSSFKRSLKALKALIRKSVDKISIYTFNSSISSDFDSVLCDFVRLNAVNFFLDTLIEVLNTKANSIKATIF